MIFLLIYFIYTVKYQHMSIIQNISRALELYIHLIDTLRFCQLPLPLPLPKEGEYFCHCHCHWHWHWHCHWHCRCRWYPGTYYSSLPLALPLALALALAHCSATATGTATATDEKRIQPVLCRCSKSPCHKVTLSQQPTFKTPTRVSSRLRLQP